MDRLYSHHSKVCLRAVNHSNRSRSRPGQRLRALVFGASLAFLISPRAELNADVIGHWRFENGTANQSAAGNGAVLDYSGNALNGTPYYGPYYRTNVPAPMVPLTGQANALAMDFNGVNTRICVPNHPQLALTNSLTLEAFIYPRTPADGPYNMGVIIFRGDDRGNLDPYALELKNRHIQFHIENASMAMALLASPDLVLNTWHHVAATLDGSTGSMRLYVDGVEVAATITTIRPFDILSGANPGVAIGNVYSGSIDQCFDGLIDEVRISNTALDPGQFLIPEPSTLALVGLGLAALMFRRSKARLQRVGVGVMKTKPVRRSP